MPANAIFTAGVSGSFTTAGDLDLRASTLPNYTGTVKIGGGAGNPATSPMALTLFPDGVTGSSAVVQAVRMASTIFDNVQSVLFPGVQLFADQHTTDFAGASISQMGIQITCYSVPTLRNIFNTAAIGAGYNAVFASPTVNNTGGGSFALTAVAGMVVGLTVNGGTVTAYQGMRVGDPAGAGTVTTAVGVDIDTLTKGGTNLSLRSAGAAVEMRHAGPARFGSSAAGPTGGSIVHVDGGLTGKRTAATDADYTALVTDLIIEFPAITAARVVNLPAAATAGAGKIYIIKKTAGAFTVTLDPSGAETIDGAATLVISAALNASRIIYCTGTAWFSAAGIN